MKRILTSILSLVMIIPLVACGGSKKTTVVDNHGNSTQLSYDELCGELSNSARFEEYYDNASISFDATVEKVTNLFKNDSYYSQFGEYYIIECKEGWKITFVIDPKDTTRESSIIMNLSTGTHIRVKSFIRNYYSSTKTIEIGSLRAEYFEIKSGPDETVIEIIK